jgi:hypothetical protein
MIEALKHFIERRNQLAEQALEQYEPLVQQLIAANSKDRQQIEHTLDGLLDFCFDDQMLLLYRKLCLHLYDFDPEAAAFYVYAYRDMWEEEGTIHKKNHQPAP